MERQSNDPLLTGPEKLIFVEWDEKDYMLPFLAISTGEMTFEEAMSMPQMNIDFIRRRQIDEFCGKCDRYKGEDPCSVGFGNQTRYVARQWCGWASVNGQGCHMTKDGIEL